MRKYKDKITLYQNGRGCWDIDPIKGCKYGLLENPKGCYGNCYAAKIAKRCGYDFSDSQKRYFKNTKYRDKIISQIKSNNMPFIRMGVMGDPSEDWKHTIDICEQLQPSGKTIVIVTKHWEELPQSLYDRVKDMDIVINTSISALDEYEIEYVLSQYEVLKSICKSILRVVTCDFNIYNEMGEYYSNIQNELLSHDRVIETVLRLPNNHKLVVDGVVNLTNEKFLNKNTYASKRNKDIFFGYCKDCPDKCGINL